MKKFIIPVLVFTMLSSCTNEVVIDTEAESQAIKSVVETMFEAIAGMDTEKFKTVVYDEFFAYDMSQVMKLDDMLNYIASMPQMGFSDVSFNVEPVESYIYEDNALACFKTTGTAKMGDQDIKMEFLESYLMLKTEEGWKIQFLHSTQLPPPAPPAE